MTKYEKAVRDFASPMKLKYHPTRTEEYAERGYTAAHIIAQLVLEQADEIKALRKEIDGLKGCIGNGSYYRA